MNDEITARNSFGITLKDAFRTASFGGDKLSLDTVDPAMAPKTPGL
ncbi:MAG TPA: hypothetical protein PKX38_10290 [Alphaproteobacteria bacterium]|mgnify:CR=1 FL=1|jgi:hypothetical protein|nr:hypothetical protein [Micavibrio sp.]MBK9561705.1 hypothetical protein [Micavibrio sp.]HQX28307.1 hypothetical protein [Alphaproteobacteria bacterium]